MGNDPKITFIMPVGRADFLPTAVGSLQAQTMPDWELLVFDNIGLDISTEDKRIHVCHTDKWSPPRCYNEGMQCAKSDYVLIATDDDVYFPERAEITLSYLERGADYFAGSCIVVDKKKNFKSYTPVHWNYEWHKKIANTVSLPFVGFNRTKVPQFNESYKICHDYLFTLQCGMNNLKIKTTRTPLGMKREWNESLYHSTPRPEIDAELERIRIEFDDPDIRSYTFGENVR